MVYVFRNPITDETLKGMAEYMGRKTTLKDRAHVALMMKNADDKDVRVREQVETLRQKAEHGDGVGATVCLIYNATGDTLTLVTHCDWHGHTGFTPYPPKIENGQWGLFLHVVDGNMDDGSVGAVVYRSKNANGDDDCDWMHAWTNTTSSKKAYSEIRELKHWDDGGLWGVVHDIMGSSGIMHRESWGERSSIAVIGNHSFPIFEVILEIQNK